MGGLKIRIITHLARVSPKYMLNVLADGSTPMFAQGLSGSEMIGWRRTSFGAHFLARGASANQLSDHVASTMKHASLKPRGGFRSHVNEFKALRPQILFSTNDNSDFSLTRGLILVSLIRMALLEQINGSTPVRAAPGQG